MFNARTNDIPSHGTVVMDKTFTVDGKRPGDSFRRGGVDYFVTRVYVKHDHGRFDTTSKHGHEVWF